MFKKALIVLCLVAMFSTAAFAQNEFSSKGFGNMSGEDSITFYERALKENPNDHVALTALGSLYANVRGDYDKSIKLFEKSIQINDRYDLAHGIATGVDDRHAAALIHNIDLAVITAAHRLRPFTLGSDSRDCAVARAIHD